MRSREELKRSALDLVLIAIGVSILCSPLIVAGFIWPDIVRTGVYAFFLGLIVLLAGHWVWELVRDWMRNI